MPNPAYRLVPVRAPGSARTCALAASRTPSPPPRLPLAAVNAKRPCPPGRRATPISPPVNQRRALTTVAPAPTSVAVSRWPWAGRAHTAPPARASTHPSELAKRDVVRDADIGRERRHDRAVFLERELDRPTRLLLVHAIPSNIRLRRNRSMAWYSSSQLNVER